MRWIVVVGIMAVALVACGRTESGPTKDDVRKAVEEFIVAKKNVTLASLRVEVSSVEAKGDEATAEVIFAQTVEPKLAMSYTYTLKRAEKGWVVAASSPVARQSEEGHGFGATPPPAPGPAQGPAPEQVAPTKR